MTVKGLALAGMILPLAAGAALAHHSFAMFDGEKLSVQEGTVKELEWTNPHVWLHIMAPDETGRARDWGFEMQSVAQASSGGWRATWAGEGGGVLINQCPHNLDLVQWLTGLFPSRVTAVGFVGKTHPIEVEDEISAILEYPNGGVGHFVTTTGEAPGTNRLEIAGDRGKD